MGKNKRNEPTIARPEANLTLLKRRANDATSRMRPAKMVPIAMKPTVFKSADGRLSKPSGVNRITSRTFTTNATASADTFLESFITRDRNILWLTPAPSATVQQSAASPTPLLSGEKLRDLADA